MKHSANALNEGREQHQRMKRIVELVTAPGSVVQPSTLNHNMVVVVDGRTWKDACAPTANECFDQLFAEADEDRNR